MSGFGDFMWWCILISWHVYFGDVWFIFAATVEKFYICMLMLLVEDVTSISWIYVLFACFIALIEVECYSEHIGWFVLLLLEDPIESVGKLLRLITLRL